ncbi:MAG: class I SAM-dependent methyltransferase [Pseudomonadota bacterium]
MTRIPPKSNKNDANPDTPDRVIARDASPLRERLAAMIAANGPISISDYMEDALFHPQFGYYTTGQPIGAAGDFITAPEISQVFGELIGLWLVQSWIDIGEPSMFNLIELGPGRGVLMADVLRVARLRPKFLDAARLWLVETSGRLRLEQQKRIKPTGAATQWADSLDDVPDGPFLLIANEFFDCLPIRQFVRTKTSWRERMVDVDPNDTAQLAFVLHDVPPEPEVNLPSRETTQEGEIYEVCQPSEAIARDLSDRLAHHKGRALIIDYGYDRDQTGETLQAIQGHAYCSPLEAPGVSDLTAHVNFASLIREGFSNGAVTAGPVPQGTFLDRLGLAARVQTLTQDKPPDVINDIEQGVARLVGSHQMGTLFKVLCLYSPGLSVPAGFVV